MMVEIENIKQSWDEKGFVGQLREGLFDRTMYNVLCESLLKLGTESYNSFSKEFVSYVWFIPIYMYRQKEYVTNITDTEFEECKEYVEELILKIFGYPGEYGETWMGNAFE